MGILFLFPVERKLEFVSGNIQRLKLIYPDFDQSVYQYLTKNILQKLNTENSSISFNLESNKDLKRYISTFLLPEDATVLRFKEPVTVLGGKDDLAASEFIHKIVGEMSTLLLPDLSTKKSEISRHNDHFLIKKFTDFLSKRNKDIEKKLLKNTTIKAQVDNREIELKFDIAWKNGSTNFVKPLSFDLSEEKSIQDKSLMNYAYLNLIGNYAKENNYRFDFIVAEPQDRSLYKSYENALGLLELTDAPKRIIPENDLENYSEEALVQLLTH
jgi:hypothetical protein